MATRGDFGPVLAESAPGRLIAFADGQSARHPLLWEGLFWAAAFVYFALASRSDDSAWSTVSMLVTLLVPLLLWRASKLAFFASILFIVQWIWVAGSIRYIETGIYISEQDAYGVATNSVSRLGLMTLPFLFGIWLVLRSPGLLADLHKTLTGRWDQATAAPPFSLRTGRFRMYVWASIAAIAAALLLQGLVNGFPLLGAVDRFAYWGALPDLKRLTYLVPIVTMMLGLVLAVRRSVKPLVVFGGLWVVQFLYSDKFSGPYFGALLAATAFFLAQTMKRRVAGSRLKGALVVILVGAGLFATVLTGYMVLNDLTLEDALGKVLQRTLALQGHVFYGVDLGMNVNHTLAADPSLFLRPNNEPSAPGGLIQLMYDVSPEWIVTELREAGVRFTAGFPAVTMASFGPVAAIPVQVALGLGYGVFARHLCRKIAALDFVGLAIAGAFLQNVVSNLLLMGDSYFLVKPLTLMLIAAMVAESAIAAQWSLKPVCFHRPATLRAGNRVVFAS
ncbi:MAG: DUF6418 domain-containing protein [Propionibacteriaceae bacterium]|nr:DUF6418 domain-containing protein [Propionibacteriaceae bacterium]